MLGLEIIMRRKYRDKHGEMKGGQSVFCVVRVMSRGTQHPEGNKTQEKDDSQEA